MYSVDMNSVGKSGNPCRVRRESPGHSTCCEDKKCHRGKQREMGRGSAGIEQVNFLHHLHDTQAPESAWFPVAGYLVMKIQLPRGAPC